jgi:hypothetical protein
MQTLFLLFFTIAGFRIKVEIIEQDLAYCLDRKGAGEDFDI